MNLTAFVISLPARADRRKEFRAAWDASGYDSVLDCRFMEGITIKPDIKGGQRVAAGDMACAVSHRKAVAAAQAAGLETVLVMEDDAVPVPGNNIATLLEDLRQCPEPWHTVNLGGCTAQWRPATPMFRFTPCAPRLFRVRGMVTTHAILYHHSAYDDVLMSVPSETEFANLALSLNAPRPYDQWLGSYGTMLTGEVPYFTQSGSSSDIIGMAHGNIADLITETYRNLRATCPEPVAP